MKNLSLFIRILILLLLTACSSKKEPFIVKFEGEIKEQKWSIKELNHDLPADWSLQSHWRISRLGIQKVWTWQQ
jgi:hypothetical protein